MYLPYLIYVIMLVFFFCCRLPKLGREKMENFNEDCKSLKDIIDFEFKTADDYVNNMDIKEKMQQRFEQLEQKLEAIENVYQIMKNIPVPVSTEDKNSLKNLKSQLKQLGQKVEEKIIAHKDILSRCWNFFIDYVCSSINFMLCLLLAGLLKH